MTSLQCSQSPAPRPHYVSFYPSLHGYSHTCQPAQQLSLVKTNHSFLMTTYNSGFHQANNCLIYLLLIVQANVQNHQDSHGSSRNIVNYFANGPNFCKCLKVFETYYSILPVQKPCPTTAHVSSGMKSAYVRNCWVIRRQRQ